MYEQYHTAVGPFDIKNSSFFLLVISRVMSAAYVEYDAGMPPSRSPKGFSASAQRGA